MVVYLCDGKMPCAKKVGCFLSGSDVGFCKHTTDPEHALYGVCPDPQNHPERFEIIRDKRTGEVIDYFEKEARE